MAFEFNARDEAATLEFAAILSNCLGKVSLIFLQGQLGAGKTTFSRGILRGLGHTGSVKSPTFTLVEPYELPRGQVYHFDLYRLADPGELEYLGVDDYLADGQLCLIEWPERGTGWLPEPDLVISLEVTGLARQIVLVPSNESGEAVIDCLKHKMDKRFVDEES